MADAQSEPVKVGIVTQSADSIAQAVVTTMATAVFEACRAGWQVQLVMSDQNGLWGNFVELRKRTDGLPAAVHKCSGNQQAQVASVKVDASGETEKLAFGAEAGARAVRQLRDKVGAGIVTGPMVLGAGITQAHNELQRCIHHNALRSSN